MKSTHCLWTASKLILAMARMVQAGARPMTALQNLLELQRDWARPSTYASLPPRR